jgi:DNA (cytosine-5)-methyltransferase 1
MNFYNEIDNFAADWLENLIKEGLIPDEKVDRRSIADIRPEELDGYEQHHFFAGIAGWSLALQYAGWPTREPVWTGSCPCQPFSAAGKKRAYEDERDLWPVWFRLIKQCRPEIVFGEQVASSEVVGTQLEAAFIVAVQAGEYARANKIANKLVKQSSLHYWARWVDRIRSDMEGEGYSLRFSVLPACSVGAPHIRQRLWWCGWLEESNSNGRKSWRAIRSRQDGESASIDASPYGRLANPEITERRGLREEYSGRGIEKAGGSGRITNGGMADSQSGRWSQQTTGIYAIKNGEGEGNRSGYADAVGGMGNATNIRCGEAEFKSSKIGSSGTERFISNRESSAKSQRSGDINRMADSKHPERRQVNINGEDGCHRKDNGWEEAYGQSGTCSEICGMGNAERGRGQVWNECKQTAESVRQGCDYSFWSASRSILCKDEKIRRIPVEPSLFPLAPRLPGRVGQLRAAGNAIIPLLAAKFIKAIMEEL